jgi:IS605 OrfB family transposase
MDDEGVEHGDRRFKTCEAVVIENLRNYRPDELQTRRENKALMNWSAGKVRKYLEESCQLHGLHLREVQPNYTSRQDSRTGLPGVRCDDVPLQAFLSAHWWRKSSKAAQKRLAQKGTDSFDRFLVELFDKWNNASDSEKAKQRFVRLPRSGGDLFVVAHSTAELKAAADTKLGEWARSALQADLNAAANTGLRALLDPDFAAKWWYVPCRAADAVPLTEKVKGSVCFGDDPGKFGSLREVGVAKRSKSDGKNQKDVTNYWADPSTKGLRNAHAGGFWLPTSAYWKWVRNRVIAILAAINGLEKPVESIDPADDP